MLSENVFKRVSDGRKLPRGIAGGRAIQDDIGGDLGDGVE
jgi:hypothetical protein